jgi:DNA polymerase-3 subunit epsilon
MGWLQRVFQRQQAGVAAPPPCDFLAVDVETASSSRASICQIGIAGFRDGTEALTIEKLINPRCAFDRANTAVHGINAAFVRSAPCFADEHPSLAELLSGRVAIAHSMFDQVALGEACAAHSVAGFDCRWIDTLAVSREVWPHFPSHKLDALADMFGIEFKHHNALEDARTAGQIFLRAMAETETTVEQWLAPHRPVLAAKKLAREATGSGPLSGHCITLTGDFSVSKEDLADLIAGAGGAVGGGVTKHTTMLVVGYRDPLAYSGLPKSGKQMKAEALAAAGQSITFVDELRLRELAGL